MNKFTLFVATLAFCGLAFAGASVVNAQSPTPTGKLRNVIPGSCNEAQGMLANRINAYRNHRGTYVDRYNQLIARTQKLITILTKRGYDQTAVAKLQTDMTTLGGMITTFGADADSAVTAMQTANDSRCGKSQGQFASGFKNAKDLMTKVRADLKAMREFVGQTIKPDIQALRASKGTVSASPTATPSPTQ